MTASVIFWRIVTIASAAQNTIATGAECCRICAGFSAAHADQVFIAYVPLSATHLVVRTHPPASGSWSTAASTE
ncbi:hypothetical protein AB0L00_45095 [Actinoallomurus sp. NPDC052308]|uniref:hypothetical protein n=1 Tax=Actinoallomurus sp. NPDC052308 TaxID=3155530 RepID=UPI0034269869